MTWTISGNVYLYFGFIISSACIVIDSSIGDYNERVRYHWFLPWATITRCRFCFCPCELKILLECHDVCPPYSKCVELTMSSTRKPVLSHQSLADPSHVSRESFHCDASCLQQCFFLNTSNRQCRWMTSNSIHHVGRYGLIALSLRTDLVRRMHTATHACCPFDMIGSNICRSLYRPCLVTHDCCSVMLAIRHSKCRCGDGRHTSHSSHTW